MLAFLFYNRQCWKTEKHKDGLLDVCTYVSEVFTVNFLTYDSKEQQNLKSQKNLQFNFKDFVIKFQRIKLNI